MNLKEQNDILITNTDEFNNITEEEFFGDDIMVLPLDDTDDNIQYIHPDDRREINSLYSFSNEDDIQWTDRLISTEGEAVEFYLDRSMKESYTSLKNEVTFIKSRLHNKFPTKPFLTFEDIFELSFGSSSLFSASFCRELDISYGTYCRFMSTLCIQMCYHSSPSDMYDKTSLIASHLIMKSDDYMSIWQRIATKKKINLDDYSSIARRSTCLWETFQRCINAYLREVTVAGRKDDINIALDDDKTWVQVGGRNMEDLFKIRRVTHVRDNRKGIVSHTAVSATTTMLLSFMFETSGDKAVDCFKTIFQSLFPSTSQAPNALPDLSGVTNHSDRGYTMKSTVFNFLLPAGADFTNTVKRIMPFPFVWKMKPTINDPRKVIDEQGAPTLYIREVFKEGRLVTCTAFRTGTNNVSAVVTTKVHGHQWEGICLRSTGSQTWFRPFDFSRGCNLQRDV